MWSVGPEGGDAEPTDPIDAKLVGEPRIKALSEEQQQLVRLLAELDSSGRKGPFFLETAAMLVSQGITGPDDLLGSPDPASVFPINTPIRAELSDGKPIEATPLIPHIKLLRAVLAHVEQKAKASSTDANSAGPNVEESAVEKLTRALVAKEESHVRSMDSIVTTMGEIGKKVAKKRREEDDAAEFDVQGHLTKLDTGGILPIYTTSRAWLAREEKRTVKAKENDRVHFPHDDLFQFRPSWSTSDTGARDVEDETSDVEETKRTKPNKEDLLGRALRWRGFAQFSNHLWRWGLSRACVGGIKFEAFVNHYLACCRICEEDKFGHRSSLS